MEILVKGNVAFKHSQKREHPGYEKPMKRPNLRKTGIAEREQTQVKDIENSFNKIIEHFPNLKKELIFKAQ